MDISSGPATSLLASSAPFRCHSCHHYPKRIYCVDCDSLHQTCYDCAHAVLSDGSGLCSTTSCRKPFKAIRFDIERTLENDRLLALFNTTAKDKGVEVIVQVDRSKMDPTIQKSPEALRIIGQAYLEGLHGFVHNPYTAMRWFERAAKQGCERSARDIRNFWLQKAKEGSSSAQYRLGCLYLSDIDFGLPPALKEKKAIFWYELAAKEGYSPALNQLGNIYSKRKGSIIEQGLAIAYYKRAALLGNVKALSSLWALARSGIDLNLSRFGITSEDMRDLRRPPRFFILLLKAESGCAQAHLEIGFLLDPEYPSKSDPILKKSYELTPYWYQKAADLGDPIAQRHIGTLLFYGIGLRRNEEVGIDYLSRSAKYGDKRALDFLKELAFKEGKVRAEYEIVKIYLEGVGVKRAVPFALRRLHHLIGKEYLPALHLMSQLLDKGCSHLKKNRELAIRLLMKAATKGYQPARADLARRFSDGDGVARSLEQARRFSSP